MIISHRHRFIFFAVPKTGTHAIRQALRLHMGEEDLEQVGLFLQKRFPFPQLSGIRHGHISALQIGPVIGEEAFRRYYKFAFVRNPFDRFVSYCAFVSRESGEFASDPQRFMRQVLSAPPLGHLLFRPQHEFLVDATGALAMSCVGRQERMQQDYDAIAAALQLPSTPLDRVNSSSHRAFHEYYDEGLAQGVLNLYRRDFQLFGYSERPDA